MDKPLLEAFGFDSARAEEFREHADPADVAGRVIGHERTALRAVTADGERLVTAGQRFRRGRAAERPVVGDWLVLQPISGDERLNLRRILTRRSELSRISSSRRNPDGAIGGRPAEQVLCSNLDFVLIITGLDEDYSLARIQRYVATVSAGGAEPVVLLNKADVAGAELSAARAREVGEALPGTAVHVMSIAAGEGMASLGPYFGPGRTVALIGSSGVGKSSLVNALLGEEAALTGATRESDGRGRHTTTWREMFLLPGGRGVIIDNPGLREVGVFTGDAADEFSDIEQLTRQCRFRSCTHTTEPGCAVLAAIADGSVDAERVEAWRERVRESEEVDSWLKESSRRRGRRPRRN